ncbi:hypothetical protein U9M48_034502 [Paspalum notatum var. saurae]|uniref:Uncharacterized protein n=1 Tax=Paspalum notatum var. saurae TaxID=547442 RepID=A0AAQ3X6U1_PASNO
MAPVPPEIPEKATDEAKTKLLEDFAALEKSYEARFGAYRLWLDEDAPVDIELRRTYVLLTRLRDEYEPLRAQLLARHPFVSLIDALLAVRNEEIRLRSPDCYHPCRIGCSFYALTAGCSFTVFALTGAVPSPSDVEGVVDGHVEAFCYRKKKAQFRSQTRPVSQSSGSASAGASQRSSTDPVTQEMLMLLRRLAASSSSGTASVATATGSPRFCCCFSVFHSGTTRIVTRVTWLVLALIVVTLSVFGSLTGFDFLPLRLPVLTAPL